MEEDIKILEEFKTKGYDLLLMEYGDRNKANLKIERALENLIKGYRELDKDNNDLRRLYRRTAVKLKENGHEEVADYFLAQINEVPTFVVEDDIDYYTEYYKMKTKIRQLEEGCKTCVIRDDLHDYVENSIPKSKIKEKFDEKCKGIRHRTNTDAILESEFRRLEKEILEDK